MSLCLKRTIRFAILVSVLLSSVLGIAQDEETIHLKTRRFKFFDDRIEFYEYTEVIKGSFKLISDEFVIRREQEEARFVDARKGVYIEFDNGSASSVILDYDLQLERGVLKEEVEAFIRTSGSDESVRILCDEMEIDTPGQIYEGSVTRESEKVRIYKGDLYAECVSFLYDGKTEIITMVGKVYIEDPKNSRRLWAERATLSLQDDSLEAENATMELLTTRGRE